jgi:hypothetical protein
MNFKEKDEYCLDLNKKIAKEVTYIGESSFGDEILNPIYKYGKDYFAYSIKQKKLKPVLGLCQILYHFGIEFPKDEQLIQNRENAIPKIIELLKKLPSNENYLNSKSYYDEIQQFLENYNQGENE